MAGEKVTMILRSKTSLSNEQIAIMTDAEGWQLIYTLEPAKSRRVKQANQVCFTGFSPLDRDRLEAIAASHGLDIVNSVTTCLAILVTGPNAGPSKCKKAREQEAVIMCEEQFARFLVDGEIPL